MMKREEIEVCVARQREIVKGIVEELKVVDGIYQEHVDRGEGMSERGLALKDSVDELRERKYRAKSVLKMLKERLIGL